MRESWFNLLRQYRICKQYNIGKSGAGVIEYKQRSNMRNVARDYAVSRWGIKLDYSAPKQYRAK